MSDKTPSFPPRNYQPQPIILVDHVGGESLRVVLNAARNLGWRLMDMTVTKGVIPRGCDPTGALIGLPIDHPAVSWATELDCPVVRIGNLPHPLDHQIPAVIIDFVAAGRIAAEYFAERNFKHLAYIGKKPWHELRVIYDKFNLRAKQLGCTCDLLRRASLAGEDKTCPFSKAGAGGRGVVAKSPKTCRTVHLYRFHGRQGHSLYLGPS